MKAKGISQFNTTQDILRFFATCKVMEVDRIQLRITHIDASNKVLRIDSNYTLWPSKTRLLSEVNDAEISHLHRLFQNNIDEKLRKPMANYLTHHLPIINNNSELFGKILGLIESSSAVHQIMMCLRKNGGTIEDILNALTIFDKKHNDKHIKVTENEKLGRHMKNVADDIEDWLEKSFEKWKLQYKVVVPNSIMTRKEFDTYLSSPHHDLKQIARIKKFSFLNKVNDAEIQNGDQVWFCRYYSGINYWHVGVLVETSECTEDTYRIIHLQRREKNRFEAKIVSQSLMEAIKDKDEMIVVRYEGPFTPTQIKERALLCCESKLTATYSAYVGSCETFASFICGTRGIKELNTQGFKVCFHQDDSKGKNFIANALGKISELLFALHRRLEDRVGDVTPSHTSTEPMEDEIPNTLSHINSWAPDEVDLSQEKSNDIGHFLYALGCTDLEPIFIKEKITMEVLPLLSENHLERMGVQTIGERLKILGAIQTMQGIPIPCLQGKKRHESSSRRSITSETSKRYKREYLGSITNMEISNESTSDGYESGSADASSIDN